MTELKPNTKVAYDGGYFYKKGDDFFNVDELE
jgi:hypothetical protein